MPKILSLALVLFCVTAVVPAVAADQSPTVTAQDHVLGKAAAPVAIIEYASLTCPHCAAFEKEAYPALKKDWIDPGKAKLIYRDFPLDRYALLASAIARCAPPDRYFAFVQSFFDSQENWVTAADPLAALKGIARLGGMNAASVDKCLADTKLQEAIVGTETQAKDDYGVNSTPTFFIIGANGTTKLIGEQPYADVNRALTNAMPKS
ncbi:MAG TPA: DsbA family protein [Stellaceae bacterium]|jgi:protein-disulfide isomerase|nr:DsbA family protein [Stellaceae bacterium]